MIKFVHKKVGDGVADINLEKIEGVVASVRFHNEETIFAFQFFCKSTLCVSDLSIFL